MSFVIPRVALFRVSILKFISSVFRSVTLPWFLLVSMVTLLAVSTKLINLQQCSSLHRGLVATLIGSPVGLKTAGLVSYGKGLGWKMEEFLRKFSYFRG